MKRRVFQWLISSGGLLAAGVLVLSSCGEKKGFPEASAEARDDHGAAVRQFLSAPGRFREVVSTIREEASYDRGAPELEEVLQGFRDSAETFRKLAPPDEVEQLKYRKMIADGFREAEPTGEDMLTLISIKTREKEISKWMKEFRAVAQEAGAEALRLYGKVDYPTDAADEPFEADLSQLKMGPLPTPSPPPRKEAVGGGSNPLLEHLGSEPAGDEP